VPHPVVRVAVVDWGSPVEPIDRALDIADPSRIRQHPELAVLPCRVPVNWEFTGLTGRRDDELREGSAKSPPGRWGQRDRAEGTG
jgi:hypothetical protein